MAAIVDDEVSMTIGRLEPEEEPEGLSPLALALLLGAGAIAVVAAVVYAR